MICTVASGPRRLAFLAALSFCLPALASAQVLDPTIHHFGTGLDGSPSVSGTVNLNTDPLAAGRSHADAVSFAVLSISGDTISLYQAPGGLAVGDEILLMNLRGSVGETASLGTFEFLEVASVSLSGLTFTTAVQNTYGEVDNTDFSGQVVLIQRVRTTRTSRSKRMRY